MLRVCLLAAGIAVASCGLNLSPNSHAGFSYIESVNGDLSGNNLLPTVMAPVTAGSNTVSGTVGGLEADIFSFVIPTGFQLDGIFLTSFSSSSANMFFSIDAGPTYQYSSEEINDQVNLPDMSLVLGSALIGTSPGVNVGSNIMPALSTSNTLQMGAGFTPPLPAGTYSVFIQETGTFSNYGLNFNVSAVPEPGLTGLLALLPICLSHLRVRRLPR